MSEEMCSHVTPLITASDLIAELQDLVNKHGDLPVFVYSSGTEPCGGAEYRSAEGKRVKLFTNSKTYPEMILIS